MVGSGQDKSQRIFARTLMINPPSNPGRGSGQDILMAMNGIGIVLHAKSNGMKRICGWVEIRSQTSALTVVATTEVLQMTDREKAIGTAHTGVNMLEGEKFNEFYKYLEELYGRPVYTHEIPFLDIQEKSKEDFIALCRGDSE